MGPRGPCPNLGGLAYQSCGRLAFLAQLELGLERFSDRALGDQAPLDVRTRWDLEHRVEKSLFDDRFESARTSPSKERELRDRIEASLLEDELDIVEREELLVLLSPRVLGLGEDAHDVLLVEVVQRDDDRQPADELRNEPVFQQVLRLQLLPRLRPRLALDPVARRAKPDGPPADPLLDDLLQPVERATADK